MNSYRYVSIIVCQPLLVEINGFLVFSSIGGQFCHFCTDPEMINNCNYSAQTVQAYLYLSCMFVPQSNKKIARNVIRKWITTFWIKTHFAACNFCAFTASGCSTPTLLKTLSNGNINTIIFNYNSITFNYTFNWIKGISWFHANKKRLIPQNQTKRKPLDLPVETLVKN